MTEQAVNAGLTIPHLGPSFVVDPVNKKVHVKSQVSADDGNKIIAGSDGGAFVAEQPNLLWVNLNNNDPASNAYDDIFRVGAIATRNGIAWAMSTAGDVPATTVLDATNTSLIRLSTGGSIEKITGEYEGKVLVLMNASAADVVLVDSVVSPATNQGISIAGGDLTLRPEQASMLQFDLNAMHWRYIGTPASSAWLKQADGTPATAATDSIEHQGNTAMRQNVAYRTKSLPTVAQLNATNASNILLTTSGTIEGITGGEDGKQLVLTNTSTGEVTLTNDSLTATAGTKIKIGDSFSFIMAPNASVLLNYDPINACWRSVSQTVLGFAPSWAQFAANAVQGLNAPNNFTFNAITASAGTDISLVGGGVRLKAGRTYRLRGFVPWSNVSNWVSYKWYDGANYVGVAGHNESATSGGNYGSGGAAEAVVKPLVDTTYWVRATGAGGSVYTSAALAPHAWVECLEGLAPASNIKLLSRVMWGSAQSPIVTPPMDASGTGAPYIQGETYIQTDTGLNDGLVLAEWRYTGAAWRRVNSITTAVAHAADNNYLRTYYTQRSAFVPYWLTALTLAQMSAHGFTGVGIAALTSPAYGQRFVILATITQGTAANKYVVPTKYLRHEVAVGTGDQMYHINLQNNTASSQVDVWVCDPVSGVPVVRLATTDQTAYAAGARLPMHIAPDNGRGCPTTYQEWLGYNIPADLVDTYKTASGTLKLAMLPGNIHGGATVLRIGGYAMTNNPYGVCCTPAMAYTNTPPSNQALVDASNPTWIGNVDGVAFGGVPNNGIAHIRVPLPGLTKDIVLSLPVRDQRTYNFGGVECTIKHTSGDVALGRPSATAGSPYLRAVAGWSLIPDSYIIPASTLAAKAVKPTNSGVYYLDILMTNVAADQVAHFAGTIVEYLNP